MENKRPAQNGNLRCTPYFSRDLNSASTAGHGCSGGSLILLWPLEKREACSFAGTWCYQPPEDQKVKNIEKAGGDWRVPRAGSSSWCAPQAVPAELPGRLGRVSPGSQPAAARSSALPTFTSCTHVESRCLTAHSTQTALQDGLIHSFSFNLFW